MDVSADGRFILSVHVGPKDVCGGYRRKRVIKGTGGKSPHGVWTLQHAPR